jgi:hypothetical protein
MAIEVLLAVGFMTAISTWVIIKHAIAMRHLNWQREVVAVGVACQGRIVAIQRPFMLDDCTRFYVDFVPSGTKEPVRVCHIERTATTERARALPAEGTTVTVCYLPDRPLRAVIGKFFS